MRNCVSVGGMLFVALTLGCSAAPEGDPLGTARSAAVGFEGAEDVAQVEAANADKPEDATTVVCGPPAKVFRWILPFKAQDAAQEIFDSDVGEFWLEKLGGPDSATYQTWSAGVSGLMQVFADSTNQRPSEPYEQRGVLGLRNVKLTCENGLAAKVTYDVDRSAGYTPMLNTLPQVGTGTNAYHVGEEMPPNDPPPSYEGSSVTISVMERSRLAPPGQWGWTLLLGYGMPWIWEKIDYTISCDGSVSATGSGSAFPSGRFTFGDQSRNWEQDDLVGFIKSGLPHDYDTLSPPGGDAPQGFEETLGDGGSVGFCAEQPAALAPYFDALWGYDLTVPLLPAAKEILLAPVQEAVTDAVDTTVTGVSAIVFGSDIAGNEAVHQGDELRGLFCGGSNDNGEHNTLHNGAFDFYVSYTPAYDDCRACCEADPTVSSLATCINACHSACSTCALGDTDVPPPASYTCERGSSLAAGDTLKPGEMICAPGGKCAATLQEDGNFVVYNNGRPVWSSGTVGQGGALVMQADCNLVLYPASPAPALWSSQTDNAGKGCRVQIQDDCNLVVVDGSETPQRWSQGK